jgi:hypothetical protein
MEEEGFTVQGFATEFKEEENYQVARAPDGDVLLTFEGRIQLPEVASAILEPGRLTIVETAGGIGLRFVNLDGGLMDWLRNAPNVYVTRIFNDTIHMTLLHMSYADE